MVNPSKMAKGSDEAEDTCYINILNDDLLAKIFSRLPTARFVANSALACKLWFQIITNDGILQRRHPQFLSLFGVFLEVELQGRLRYLQSFVRADKNVTGPEGPAAKASNVQAMPNGHWSIADSLDDVLLLRRLGHKLVIYHPSTGDLTELPSLPVSKDDFPCFVGAGMLRDGAGSGPGKVVCALKVLHPGYPSWCGSTWVYSFDTGRWESLSFIRDAIYWSLPARAGDALISSVQPTKYNIGVPEMLSMHTGRAFQVCLPNPNCAFIDDACADKTAGGNRKLWLVTMDDYEPVLRLYSHAELGNEDMRWQRCNRYSCCNWVQRKEENLRHQVEELVGVSRLEQWRPRNIQSRNGYVFFKTEEHGYFAVHLHNMRVQQLSGVDKSYMGHLYPYMSSSYVHLYPYMGQRLIPSFRKQ